MVNFTNGIDYGRASWAGLHDWFLACELVSKGIYKVIVEERVSYVDDYTGTIEVRMNKLEFTEWSALTNWAGY